MVLQQLFRFSSLFRSSVSLHLRRNIGLTAVACNKTKELDPIQKLFVDKIREYRTKSQTKILAHQRAQKSGPGSVPHPLAHQSLSVGGDEDVHHSSVDV
ncbi:unnamed protein product [Ranitomeya imitator]|uniref:ATP synthase peripheral stalk subunit F6, mitochondrial n=1 Tax=Ranitomeya imitator TaxID=111125 RepID=A0ABN9M814_9NEOB|nr:unnamed protein product [Ranitomeya imitator]